MATSKRKREVSALGQHDNSLITKLFKGELGPEALAKYRAWKKRSSEDSWAMEKWWAEYNGWDGESDDEG